MMKKGGYVNPNQHLAIPAWHLIPSTDHPPTLISQWSSSSVPSSSLSSSSVQSSSLSSQSTSVCFMRFCTSVTIGHCCANKLCPCCSRSATLLITKFCYQIFVLKYSPEIHGTCMPLCQVIVSLLLTVCYPANRQFFVTKYQSLEGFYFHGKFMVLACQFLGTVSRNCVSAAHSVLPC